MSTRVTTSMTPGAEQAIPVGPTIRRLDRQSLTAPGPARPAGTASQQRLDALAAHPEAPPDDLQLSTIADNSFRVRPVTLEDAAPATLENAAQVGLGLYGVVNASRAVPKTFVGLMRPNLPLASRVAVAGKLLRETAWLASSGANTINGLRGAQKELSRHVPKLQQVTTLSRFTDLTNRPTVTRLLDKAKVAGAVGGLGLATVALPTLAKSAVTRTGAAIVAFSRPGVSGEQRLSAVKDAAYANAGTLFALATIPTAVRSLASAGAAAGALGRGAGRLAATGTFKRAEDLGNTLSPIADLTLFAADAIHLHQTLRDPKADRMAKFQAGFNVGLDVTKLTLNVMPQSSVVRTAYTVAGLAQFGLAIRTLVTPDKTPAPKQAPMPAPAQALRPLTLQQN